MRRRENGKCEYERHLNDWQLKRYFEIIYKAVGQHRPCPYRSLEKLNGPITRNIEGGLR